MNRFALLAILLICTSVFGQQQVSFTGLGPKPGQTFVRTSSYNMNVDVVLKFAGDSLKEHNNTSTITVRKTEAILATQDDAVTKLKVTYNTVDSKFVITEDGIAENRKQEKNPVLGRTYIVSVQNGKVSVTDDHGIKPAEEEFEIVQNDYEGLGEADSFLQFFRQKTVQVGEPLQMPGVLAEGVFTDAQRRRVKVDNASFVLRAVRQNSAIFDTALKMQWNQDANTSVKMNVTGETMVGIQNSRMMSSTLKGTVRVTGVEQLYNRLVMVDGKGKIALTDTLQIR